VLSHLRSSLPETHIVRREVPTPFEQKGLVMRTLVERADPAQLVLLDGVKTIDENGWTLVLPDPETPFTHIHAEARTKAEAEERVDRTAADIDWIVTEGAT
jgi:mannose-1-phosphate guanylyltransferase/phosphomannomutase